MVAAMTCYSAGMRTPCYNWMMLVGAILANGVVTTLLTWWLSRSYGIAGVIAATTTFSLLVTAWLFPVLCWRTIGPRR
jgi:Mg2+/Co2+ transporter CorB